MEKINKKEISEGKEVGAFNYEKTNGLEISKGSEAGAVSNTVDGFVDYKGRPANKKQHGGIKATIFVFVTSALENMANLGTSVNLVTYFFGHMYYSISDSANILTNYMGTTFLLSLVGAFISDAYLTRSKTLLLFGIAEFLGFMLLAIQAHTKSLQMPLCNITDPTANCPHASGRKSNILFVGLYLTALGSGGLKATLPTLGADQFDDKDPKERKLISSFFNFYLFSLCVGSSLGVIFLVWLQDNKGWDIALTISSSSILLGLLVIALGYKTYRNRIPTGSPFTKIIRVFIAAFRNRNFPKENKNAALYEENEDEMEKLAHTHQFKFLDKAAMIPHHKESLVGANSVEPTLCTVTQVEEVKLLLRMVPIFACTVLMNTSLAQLQTFSVQQGMTMDKKLGTLEIPPASLPIIPMTFIVILTPVYDRVFVPMARRLTGIETGITHLQRVGVGLVLSTLSMAAAAIVEIKRKNVAEEHNLVVVDPRKNPLPMSVFYLSFQFFIFGIADLFTFVGLLEFFYSQAPKRFQSLGTAFSWCSMSLGYFLSSALVDVVNAATKNSTASKGWLYGNNINVNHLDLFYWLLAVLNFLNFFNYLYWANWYRYKKVGTGVVADADNATSSSSSSQHGLE
ncbi:hypothetical protein AAC387_Pa05g3083 [Persea americana]